MTKWHCRDESTELDSNMRGTL